MSAHPRMGRWVISSLGAGVTVYTVLSSWLSQAPEWMNLDLLMDLLVWVLRLFQILLF